MKIVAVFILVVIMWFLIDMSNTDHQSQPPPNQAPSTEKDSAQSRIQSQSISSFKKMEAQ
jgi:hypothetical protein